LHGLDLKDAYLIGFTYTHNKQQKKKRKMIELFFLNKKYKTKPNENKYKEIILKYLLSVYMKLDPNDQLPPSRIHKAQVLHAFE
jgi:hypothetical protein